MSTDVDRLLADLARWASDERVDGAARSRSRERWLHQQAAEDARLSGLAADLAERQAQVAVTTGTGRVHRGVIVAVASDFWVVQASGAAATLVALAAIATLRTAPLEAGPGGLGPDWSGPVDADAVAGDPRPPLDLRLAHALASLAAQRPRVSLDLAGHRDPLTGELRSVGADMLTVLAGGMPPAAVYVSLLSVMACSILGSG